ncbi:glycosyltransferase family 2 protein [Filimonas effusa]|uniref:Glycosyltransferase n=1 Tax=Filimonas effusa TaxID=2508721 RepID=A0A4Q1DE69_9BACT|nr:glycosyltransferase family 2 protein [Filimonas effusa]RXK87278.1 glycosyltransferase [Filimonas effusa]
MSNKKLSVLIPVFNEEGNIAAIVDAIRIVFEQLPPYDHEILFVNDGSIDASLQVIKRMAAVNPRVKFISFSRNFGKDNALLAGCRYATGDAVITMDADLQHPPELIPEMLGLWESGNDVVYAYRADRNRHVGKLNQLTSRAFYKLVNALSDVKLEDGISDYRLLDKKVVVTLNQLPEERPFFRGLVKWVGFQQVGIPYTPAARASGETKYSQRALARLALQGITSFSVKPLQIAIYLGFGFSLIPLLYIPYVLYSFYHHLAISGWASLIMTVLFFGGLQLMILGILGVYLGKLFTQSKQRPQFIVQETNAGCEAAGQESSYSSFSELMVVGA